MKNSLGIYLYMLHKAATNVIKTNFVSQFHVQKNCGLKLIFYLKYSPKSGTRMWNRKLNLVHIYKRSGSGTKAQSAVCTHRAFYDSVCLIIYSCLSLTTPVWITAASPHSPSYLLEAEVLLLDAGPLIGFLFMSTCQELTVITCIAPPWGFTR